MDTFFKFFYEFLSQFFSGFVEIFKGIWYGIKAMFNIPEYLKIINTYKADFTITEWILFGVGTLIVVALIGLVIFLIVFLIRKYLRFRKTIVEQESMLEEISTLNNNFVI